MFELFFFQKFFKNEKIENMRYKSRHFSIEKTLRILINKTHPAINIVISLFAF
jgi:hypothetical protein